jgi:gliding motility-associated-like protein
MRHKHYMLSLGLFCLGAATYAQSWQWAKEANSGADEQVWDVSCDAASSSVYAGGFFKGNISAAYGVSFSATNGGSDGFVAKYNSATGAFVWAFKIGGPSDDEVRSVATDALGNVYATGYFNGTVDFDPGASTFNLTASGSKDGFLAKYNTSGALLWAVRFSGSGNCETWKVCTDPSGNLYVTGQYDAPLTFYSTSGATATTSSMAGQLNMFACKYDAGGIVQWAISGGSSKDDIGYGITADNNNVYLTGNFNNSFALLSTTGSSLALLNANTGNKFDVYVAAFSQAGTFLWITSAGSDEDDTSIDIAQDANNLYITGTIKGDADFPFPSPAIVRNCQGGMDVFLASLSKSGGTFQWVSTQTGSGPGDEEACAVNVNNDGTILVSGYFRTSLSFAPFGLPNLGPASGKDVFLSGFDASGNILWAKNAGGPGDDVAYGLAHDNTNNVYTGGEHKDAAVFGAITLTNAGAKNIFVAKYGCSPLSNNSISTPQTICSGNAPATLTGTSPTGGSTPYAYIWKQSADNVSWTNASGINNTASYSPPALAANTYYQRITSSTGFCADVAASASLLITVTPLPSAAAAGNDQTICASTGSLAGNNPGIGTGLWSLLSGSGTINTPGNYNSSVSGLGVGTNKFIWTISNSPCAASSDTVSIIRNAMPTTANAGSNQTICSSSANLSGNIPVTGTGVWSVAAGSATVNNPSFHNSSVSGLSTGSNSFVWSISNGVCPVSRDTVRISVDALPTVSAAGNDQAVCATSSVMDGNNPMVGAGTWSLLSGSGTIANPGIYNSAVTSLGIGTNKFIWRISNGTCPSSRDTVSIVRSQNPSTAYAGNNQTICSSSAFLNAVNPFVGTGSWQVYAGSGTINDPTNDNTTVSGLSTGINSFVWTVSNGSCPSSTDTVIVTVDEFPTASNAGNDQTICSTSYTLSGNVPTVGSGSWSVLSGAGSILNINIFNSLVNSLSVGNNRFIWTISNGTCPSSKDTVVIVRNANPSTAFAGSDQTICSSNAFINAVSPSVGNGSWQVFSGSGVITDPTNDNTTVSSLSTGSNAFVWTVTNGVCPSSSDTVVVTVDENPTVSNAGSNQTICSSTAVLNANAPAAGTGNWSVFAGTATVATPGSNATNVSGLGTGANSFIWTISNGVCPPSRDTVQVYVDAMPSAASAGSNQSICDQQSFQLQAAFPVTGTGNWQVLGGSAVIASPAQPHATASNLVAGDNLFSWTVSNGVCPSSVDSVIIHMDESPTASDAGSHQALCISASPVLSGNSPIVGTGLWSVVSGTASIADPTLAATAVSGLVPGNAVFAWTISNGVCPSSSDTVGIHIDALPDAASAGPDQSVCGALTILSASSVSTGTGVWSVNDGSGLISNVSLAVSPVTGLGAGNNAFVWTVSNGVCPASTDTVLIHSDELPSVSLAGNDVIRCGDTIQLAGNTPQIGAGDWSLLNGTGTFSDLHAADAQVINFPAGPNAFVWTIRNGVCPASTDTVIIRSDARPTAALAGTDKHVCSSSTSLAANNPLIGIGTWVLISGDATVSDSASPVALISNLDVGQLVLRWKISNGVCPVSSDDIVITRDAFPDTAHAGIDLSSDIPEVQLSANAPLTGTGEWTVVSGNGTFDDVNDPLTKVKDLGVGTNVFKWSIHNGVCPANTDELIIILNPLKIPNGFSPNDDGVNDAFVIPSLDYYPDIHLSIFNRWGNVVFESDQYKNDWNGKNNAGQLLSDDTYYYVLEVRPGESYNGFIILKTNK